MSDGPHRSLSQPRSWMKVAKAAELPAYRLKEIAEAREAALKKDCATPGVKKALQALRELMLGNQREMFGPRPEAFSGIRTALAHDPMATLVVDHVERAHSGRLPAEESLAQGLESALRARDIAQGRSAEEHCVRETMRRRDLPPELPATFRERLEASRPLTNFRDLAHSLAAGEKPQAASASSGSHVDEGVPL